MGFARGLQLFSNLVDWNVELRVLKVAMCLTTLLVLGLVLFYCVGKGFTVLGLGLGIY